VCSALEVIVAIEDLDSAQDGRGSLISREHVLPRDIWRYRHPIASLCNIVDAGLKLIGECDSDGG
jgi:hypothetical protein